MDLATACASSRVGCQETGADGFRLSHGRSSITAQPPPAAARTAMQESFACVLISPACHRVKYDVTQKVNGLLPVDFLGIGDGLL